MRRSRKDRRAWPAPDGLLTSTLGDSEAARDGAPRRVGSLDAEQGVAADADRCWVLGAVLEYGLGVVRLRGLK